MYLWEQTVGTKINSALALATERRTAFTAACCEGALLRTRGWFEAGGMKTSIPVLENGIRQLWARARNPKASSPIAPDLIRDLHALYPDEDDLAAPRGWGEIVSAVTLACEIANGAPVDSLQDCVCYAYQAVMEMAIRVEAGKAKSTGATLEAFELSSPLCRAEAAYQSAALAALESGRAIGRR